MIFLNALGLPHDNRCRDRRFARIGTTLTLAAALAATTLGPALAADEAPANAAAVTVIKAAKACFADTVDVYGILLPKEEVAVRPDRPGLKVTEVLVDAGQTVAAGQALARLAVPEGGSILVQAPSAGIVGQSSAIVGAIASGKGEALFTIITGSEFDLVAQVPTRDLSRLKVDQPVNIKIIGAGDLDGKVRRVAATVEPNTQLGQVFISVAAKKFLLVNSPGRAAIRTGESCGVSVPLTAILYSSSGTVIQVVRRQRIETRRVETGLMAGGNVEIREGLTEGEIVVARAGALLREGDQVRPVTVAADSN
jgi:multidrug efflux pump subunit AcrA (membrane-fusion protein)